MSSDDDSSTSDMMDFAQLESPSGWDFIALQEQVEKSLPEILKPIPLSCEDQMREGPSVVFHVVVSTSVRAFADGRTRLVHSFPLHIAPLHSSLPPT